MKFNIRLLDNETGNEKAGNVEGRFVHTAITSFLKKQKKTSELSKGHYTLEIRSLGEDDE